MADSTPLITLRTAPVRRRFELPEELLTVAEVASVLRLCRATVYRMAKDGVLPVVRVLNSVRISREALAAFMLAPSPEARASAVTADAEEVM